MTFFSGRVSLQASKLKGFRKTLADWDRLGCLENQARPSPDCITKQSSAASGLVLYTSHLIYNWIFVSLCLPALFSEPVCRLLPWLVVLLKVNRQNLRLRNITPVVCTMGHQTLGSTPGRAQSRVLQVQLGSAHTVMEIWESMNTMLSTVFV